MFLPFCRNIWSPSSASTQETLHNLLQNRKHHLCPEWLVLNGWQAISTTANSEMDSPALLHRPRKNPLVRWDIDVYYHNDCNTFGNAGIWKTVEKKMKPCCTVSQNSIPFLNFKSKDLSLSSFYVCVWSIFSYEMTHCIHFFFSDALVIFLKLLDSLSIISPDHYQQMQAVPLVYVAAKSFWHFYEVQAYITSSHSLQMEYWLMIPSFGAARVWILIKHPNAPHSQFQENFMQSPWEIHSLIW